MAGPKYIPAVFNQAERALIQSGDTKQYKDLFVQIQKELSTLFEKDELAGNIGKAPIEPDPLWVSELIPEITGKEFTIFGFEGEFAQSVFGREAGQVTSEEVDLTAQEKLTWASLENLFHIDIEESLVYQSDINKLKNVVGLWALGTDYYDVLELGTPGIKYTKVWKDSLNNIPVLKTNEDDPRPWKKMIDIGQCFEKALYIATSERFYNAVFDIPILDQDHNHKDPKDKKKDVKMVLEMLRGPKSNVGIDYKEKSGLINSWGIRKQVRNYDDSADQALNNTNIYIKAKDFTLHPSEMPNLSSTDQPSVRYDNIIQGKIQRNFVKNGVSLIAPQYNITLPATCALELVDKGAELEASFDSKYLDALNSLHLGFRKYFKSQINPQPNSPASLAVTYLSYYLTNICGLPSQIRGDIRTNTKYSVCKNNNVSDYLNKIKLFEKTNKDYDMKAWCYTHSWIKDIAHTWIKANGITTLDKVIECLQGNNKKEFLHSLKLLIEKFEDIKMDAENFQEKIYKSQGIKQSLSNGDISDPLLAVSDLMNEKFIDRKFVRFILNPVKLVSPKEGMPPNEITGRPNIYKKYKPGLYIKNQDEFTLQPEFSPSQYSDKGYQQIVWAITNATRSIRYHLYKLPGEQVPDNVNYLSGYENITWCREDTYKVFSKKPDKENDPKPLYPNTTGMLVTEIRDQEYLEYLNGNVDMNRKGG